MIKKYNTIITYGTFDLFHIGHLNLLKRLHEMCINLIVGVSTDEFNAVKGKKCIIPYDQRSAIVASCKYVTAVFSENNWEQKQNDIRKYKADAFAIGDDWKGKFDYLNNLCDVIYLERTPNISSTQIKSALTQI